MNILITGAKGFVGRNLTENLKNIRDGKNHTRPNIQIDEIYEYLTAHELLELPQAARSEYVLYRWNDTFANTENIRAMVERLKYQVECFNDALPYRAGQSYGDRAASQIRVIYRIT